MLKIPSQVERNDHPVKNDQQRQSQACEGQMPTAFGVRFLRFVREARGWR